jgi:hypothetical protein
MLSDFYPIVIPIKSNTVYQLGGSLIAASSNKLNIDENPDLLLLYSL